MAFDWNNLLGVATDLAGKPDEASIRSAISRAYYFVFHLAYGRAMAHGARRGKQEGTHAFCWRVYADSRQSVACQQIATNGERIKAKRVWADYKNYPHAAPLDSLVRRTIEEAEQFKRDIDALDARFPLP